jgi:hypothetical protein
MDNLVVQDSDVRLITFSREPLASAPYALARGSRLNGCALHTVAQWVIPLVSFWAMAVALQLAGGAYQNEFGGHPDEASHYVTGLLVHDYLAGGDWLHPLQYAEDYYRHYPRVSLGHWPPFFYMVQAAWTLPLGTSRFSVLLLMALITALTAVTLWHCVRMRFDSSTAWLIGLLYVALPLVQRYDAMLMADTLTGLLFFWSALSFGRFVKTGFWRWAAAFGVLASLTILTKGSGISLALVPPLGVLFSRRFDLLARPAFWLPALIVVVVCAPWYWLTCHMAATGLTYSAPTLDFTIPALDFYSCTLVEAAGAGLFVLAVVGLWQRLFAPAWKDDADGLWAAAGACLLDIWVFDWAVPVNFEDRYLIPALPPLMLFLAAGMQWVAERLPALDQAARTGLVGLAVVIVFVFTAFFIPADSCGGFDAAGQRLLANPVFKHANLLVSSDSLGEGMFIAAVAEREQRPGHTILRASKVLGTSDWMGHVYTSFCHTPEEMMQLLQKLNVDVVVLDTSAPPARDMAHHALLIETIKTYPDRWQVLSRGDVLRQGERNAQALRLCRMVANNKP